MTEYIDRMPTMHEYAEGKRMKHKPTDLISRADAIEAVLTYFIPRSHTGERGEYEEDFVRTIFKSLPSADAVQGEWIYKTNDESVCEEWECSKCGNWNFVETDFCPHCGVRMKGGDAE